MEGTENTKKKLRWKLPILCKTDSGIAILKRTHYIRISVISDGKTTLIPLSHITL